MSQSQIPNKCDICGLKVESSEFENTFQIIKALRQRKITPKGYYSNVTLGIDGPGYRSFCAINYTKGWRNTNRSCPHWHPEIGLKKGDYLSMHLSKKIYNLTWFIFAITCILSLPLLWSIALWVWKMIPKILDLIAKLIP